MTAPYTQQLAKTNTLAIISLVSSFFIGLAGIITGAIALKQIKQTQERGHGLAMAGIIVGALNIIGLLLITILTMVAAASIGTTY